MNLTREHLRHFITMEGWPKVLEHLENLALEDALNYENLHNTLAAGESRHLRDQINEAWVIAVINDES